jgi:N-acetylneuraminic acid mutarotase
MKKHLLLLTILLFVSELDAQLGVNPTGAAPNPSAMLDVSSTTKGFLPPRMTTAQRTAIASPVDGLMVFDTNTQSYWFKQSGGWVSLSASSSGSGVPTSGILLSTENDNQNLIGAGYQRDGFVYMNKYASNNTNTWAKSINTGTSNTLTSINTVGGHTALWTGTKMLLWGGGSGSSYLNNGYLYDPYTDTNFETTQTGVPFARVGHVAVWTGSKMIVWGGIGGYGSSGPSNATGGGVYNPSTNTWSSIANWSFSTPNDRGFNQTTAVWTGTEMIVWGGRMDIALTMPLLKNVGGRYNPNTNTWTTVSNTNAPTARRSHVSVWTGSKMIIWGGYSDLTSINTQVMTGGIYDPATDTWTSMSNTNAPTGFTPQTAIWTGTEMVVFYDSPSIAKYLYRYNPATNVWTTSPAFYPASNANFSTIFTGTKIIYFGGGYNGVTVYDVNTNTFDPFSVTLPAGYPVASIPFSGHTAIWTGLEMIVFANSAGHILRPNFSISETPTPYFLYKKN